MMQLFQSNKYKFSVVYVVILYTCNTYKIKFNILTLRVMLIGS